MNGNYGWICPKCGRGNAPWKESCDCVNPIPHWPIPWYSPQEPSKTGDPLPPLPYTICEIIKEE